MPRESISLLISGIYSCVSAFFFFKFYGDHPDLHSFPTRRSSDLPASAARSPRFACHTRRTVPSSSREAGRSEEHTSELQSPCNLVCRLLLEKKKITHLQSMLFSLIRCLTN